MRGSSLSFVGTKGADEGLRSLDPQRRPLTRGFSGRRARPRALIGAARSLLAAAARPTERMDRPARPDRRGETACGGGLRARPDRRRGATGANGD